LWYVSPRSEAVFATASVRDNSALCKRVSEYRASIVSAEMYLSNAPGLCRGARSAEMNSLNHIPREA
jgi:hypothetical protein